MMRDRSEWPSRNAADVSSMAADAIVVSRNDSSGGSMHDRQSGAAALVLTASKALPAALATSGSCAQRVHFRRMSESSNSDSNGGRQTRSYPRRLMTRYLRGSPAHIKGLIGGVHSPLSHVEK